MVPLWSESAVVMGVSGMVPKRHRCVSAMVLWWFRNGSEMVLELLWRSLGRPWSDLGMVLEWSQAIPKQSWSGSAKFFEWFWNGLVRPWGALEWLGMVLE